MPDRPPFDPARIAAPAREGSSTALTLSVRQVNELVAGAIARHLPTTLHVVGEVGDLSRPSSGHVYFTLKDEASELRCVMWRSAAATLRFHLETGLQVVATGGIEVYNPRGTYQLIARRVEPRGVGALELAFRQLREKLEGERLFDPRRKRPLPRIPRTIAIVTSPAGAALHDILKTLARRFPAVDVLFFPCRVQGDGAAAEIAAAIRLVNTYSALHGAAGLVDSPPAASPFDLRGPVDVAIIGRGGGSLEDLWAFNEEIVARAIAASAVPIVSAVGHEVDVTISDLVADVRAATPTAAAELVTPRLDELLEWLDQRRTRITRRIGHTLDLVAAALRERTAREPLARPAGRLREAAQRIDELSQRLRIAAAERFRAVRERLTRADLVLLRVGTGGLTAAAAMISRRVDALQRTWTARQRAAERRLHTLTTGAARAPAVAGLGRYDERLRQLARRAARAAAAALGRCRERLASRADAATARDPRHVLRRGYSLTRDARSGRILRSVSEVRDGQRILTELVDGTFRSTAEDPQQPGLFE